MQGIYIVIEGIVGSGKSTQGKLLEQYLTHRFPNREVVRTFEPGGSEIANAIRKLVQGTEFNEEMSPWCDAYLYASSRAQTLNTIVKPNLEKGNIVISDRNFISSLTIQGYAQELGPEIVTEVNKPLFKIAFPDVVIQLDISPEVGLSRIYDIDGDKFEKKAVDFYQKVSSAYEEVKKYEIFRDKWITVDVNNKTPEQVHQEIKEKLSPFLQQIKPISHPSKQTTLKKPDLEINKL